MKRSAPFIWDLVWDVADLLRYAKRHNGRKYRRTSFYMPGLQATGTVMGRDLQDILVPPPPASLGERLHAVNEVLPVIASEDLSRTDKDMLRGLVGTQASSFIQQGGRDVASRYTHFLWCMGRAEGCEVEIDKPSGTLLIHDEKVVYGVKAGRVVGGQFEGEALVLPLEKALYRESRVETQSRSLIDASVSLKTRDDDWCDQANLAMFALYRRYEWDRDVMFWSMVTQWRRIVDFNSLLDVVNRSATPIDALAKKLIGVSITPTDFRYVFGDEKRLYHPVREQVREKLVVMLYSLPFIRKKNKNETDRYRRKSA